MHASQIERKIQRFQKKGVGGGGGINLLKRFRLIAIVYKISQPNIIHRGITFSFKSLFLKGLCNNVKIRDSGAKVVTSMLDVQLKII